MKKIVIILSSLLVIAMGIFIGYSLTIGNTLPIVEPQRINIPSGTEYTALLDTLEAHHCFSSRSSFSAVATARGLSDHVKSGSYLLTPGMTTLQVVNKLYSGNQDAVRITINKYRKIDQLCQYLGEHLELSPDTLLTLLGDSSFCSQYGETPQTVIGLFPRNTYQVYWNVTPAGLLKRMQRESDTYWQSRGSQLAALGMSRQQVITLASIVEEETNANEEKADIASVYLNRLRIGMPLQADPTVKYALDDFTIRRILNSMLSHPSPYNTYLHAGLPPGPICIPSSSSIDAVLQNKKTPYIYFCAKEDFSGRHNFSATLSEHLRNAERFHKALNNKNIK